MSLLFRSLLVQILVCALIVGLVLVPALLFQQFALGIMGIEVISLNKKNVINQSRLFE